uniref:Transporter, cation-chloride cotransporter (CCC) family n=1 Tax=Candidatus Kentrum sp. DK TaxID=2126562 RepID=A0A450S8X9_9GAMM|nr:MAG: transporter, cation-chloride cotransporter (CCC) family [Candidatus Kentron sp. DK]
MNRKKFGTFGGVFTPSLLTILGVIMFLRFPAVVGHAGVWNALLILLGATAISLITGLSISSIATNMHVKGGGAYYLISRSLGVEFGGVIAIFFFVAQAVAVTLYVVGFTEAVFSAFSDITLSFRFVATITNVIVFVCVYIGAGWTIRIQYGILAVLILSILSFFVGAGTGSSFEILNTNLEPHWSPEFSFFTVFALFFPAVTGIMAGVNMSGDLKDPSRAIPMGTFAAIGFSTLVYVVITVLLATSVPRAELVGGGFVIKDYAFSPTLVYAGVFCATLSSALGSMMGAPRILQAFSRDNIFSRLRWFGQGSGSSGEPRHAIVMTFLIAQVGVLVGDLNTIAPVITMFFLMTYATVNLACFYEGRSRNPSFRPTFFFNHWSVALLGAFGCIGVMFLINALWASVALVLGGVFYFFIARAEIQVKWGDLGGGLSFQLARNALLRMERERYHPKNWRPSILALSGGTRNRLYLAQYACWFTVDSGIVSIGQIIRGELDNLHDRRREAESILRKFLFKEKLPAFPVVVVEQDLHAAVKALLQCHGIGGMRPNTVMLGWSENPERSEMFWETIATVKELKRSLIIVAAEEKEEQTIIPGSGIDIWWDSAKNVELMLLLSFMLKKNRQWRDHPIRLIRPVSPKADIENIEKEMSEMLTKGRIEADIVVVQTEDPFQIIQQHIYSPAVLFSGFEPGNDEENIDLLPGLQRIIDLPGDVFLVYNAGDVSIDA